MDTSHINSSLMDKSCHPLNSSWIVWYHNPSDQSWTQDSYRDILEISTVEDFLVLKNSWNDCLPIASEGMYFLMRKLKNNQIIYPLWEDINNRNGGVWTFKVPKDLAISSWFKLMEFTIGETTGINANESIQINGISISPKKNFCILKIWNTNCNRNDNNLLNPQIKTMFSTSEILYNSHNSNIARDQIKIEKCKEKNRPIPKRTNLNFNKY